MENETDDEIRIKFSKISKFKATQELLKLNRDDHPRVAGVEEVQTWSELIVILYDDVDRATIVGMIGNIKNLSVQ